MRLPFDANCISGFAIVNPTTNKQGPFEHVGSNQEVKRDAAESITLQEGHQEAEAHKHHAVDVHEH